MGAAGVLTAEKPIGMLSKTIKISDYKALFASVAKTVLSAASLQWDAASQSLIDTFAAIGLANSEEELAWVLINRSMMQAILDLIYENRPYIKVDSEEAFLEKMDGILSDGEITIDKTFFDNPKSNKIVADIQALMQKWLECINVSEVNAKAIIHRLPSYFVYQLNDEWKKNGSRYKDIADLFDNPFSKATIRELEWERYSAYLEKQINESIFGETFGLSQIYIPLCAYYAEKGPDANNFNTHSKKKRYIAVDLESHIEEWISKNDRKDAIKVISGGPGSGKSSFAKILSAKLSTGHNVLFIPLHLIDLKSDLGGAIDNFVRLNGFFTDNPYETEEKLIIIFDGLDELTQQGKACTEVAKQFIEEVDMHVKSKNLQKICLQVIITGRELVVQSNEPSFRIDGTILHVFPYYVPETERDVYTDENQLLKVDKRNAWWSNYGKLTGHGYRGLPEELKSVELDEITSHPLLNYLVSMSYDRKKISFTQDTNMNIVYADLINAVYERGYAEGVHKSLNGIEDEQFNKVLEEIAISAWHGTGRTTTVKEIQEHCRESNMTMLLDRFQESAQAGVTNLLTAFYFRQSGSNASGEKTFEFTHKSFCEYLMSKRIVRQLYMSAEMLSEDKIDTYRGWTRTQALHQWAVLCGKSPLDFYSFRFLCDEIRLQDKETVEIWQKMLCGLIGHMLRNGMPFEEIVPRPSFLEESRQSRNAEEAMLVTLSACSRVTGSLSRINWENGLSAGEWIGRLMGQRSAKVFVLECLNNLDLSDCVLYVKDFVGANLRDSSLLEADMESTNLYNACLNGAFLKSAFMIEANLRRASLQGANLQEAELREAILREADLQLADLEGANLSEASLRDVNAQRANMQKADLQRADLRNAKLQGADLREADLKEANLRRANLQRAKLEGAILLGANLRGALMDKEALEYCKAQGALLSDYE